MAQSHRVLLWAVVATAVLAVVDCTCHEPGSEEGEQLGSARSQHAEPHNSRQMSHPKLSTVDVRAMLYQH